MDVTTDRDSIVIIDRESGAGFPRAALDAVCMGVAFAAILLAIQIGLPWFLDQPNAEFDLWPLIAATIGIGCIGALVMLLLAPFDRAIECSFDLAGRRCTYRRWIMLRAWSLTLRDRRDVFAFGDISALGLREHNEADGYLYSPVLVIGESSLPLAHHRGSYPEFDSKLEPVRAATGIAKANVSPSGIAATRRPS